MIPQIKQGDIIFVDGEGIKVSVNPEHDMQRHGKKLKLVLRKSTTGYSYMIVYEREPQ